MLRSWKFLAGTAAALAVMVGGGMAFAQTDTGGTFLGDVAERLGITEERLVDAVKEESLERLEQAVEDGRLSAERAERIRERIEAGELPFGAGIGPGFGHHPGGHVIAAAADFLGLTIDELFEELRAGEKTLAEIAVEQGKTQAGLEKALLTAAEERLDQAVAEGHLTEAEKAEKLAQMEEHINGIVEGTFAPRTGGHGHFGPPPADRPADEPAAGNAVLS